MKEKKLNKNTPSGITCNIAKKGFRGMRSSSPASSSVYLDSDVRRNPFQDILPPFKICYKKIKK